MANWIVAIPAVLLVLNIITGITVMKLMMNMEKARTARALHAKEMNKNMEKVYLEANGKPWPTFKNTYTQVNPNRGTTIRNWALTNGAETNFLHNGMRYDSGSITVPITGMYFVYSHLKYFSPTNDHYGLHNIFHHGIFRYNALTRTEETLLANHVTQCKEGLNDGAHLGYSSDIRGVVYLNVGDKLTVKASHLDMLTYDRDWHYFGAYLI